MSVGGGVGAAAGASDGVPVNLPIPGKRSPTVSGRGPECPSVGAAGCVGGGGAAVVHSAGFAGEVCVVHSGGDAGAAGVVHSAGLGGAAVSQSGGGAAAVPGAGTRPSATRRGSTSSVMRRPGGRPYVG